MTRLFISLLIALAGLTACKSDDIAGDAATVPFAEGGYVKMNLRLPSARASRAANDDFGDGKLEEYAIKDATLILFQGDDEASAEFHSAYPLNFGSEMDGSSQITSVSKVVKSITDDGRAALNGKKLYALVVINNNGLIQTSEDNLTMTVCGQTFNGLSEERDVDFDTFSKLIVSGGATKLYSANDGFLMTNAPLASMPGGKDNPEGAQITTLTEVTPYVCRTETEAYSKPSIDIYVERAVAKVTMTQVSDGTLSSSNIVLDDGSDDVLTKKIPWKILDWRLDVTNQKEYLVRNVSEDWNGLRTSSETPAMPYRFVGSSPVRQSRELYRTYWGMDPNYSSFSDADFTYISGTFDTRDASKIFGDDNPQYCMENTFDVDHQRQERTTRAVVKVQIGDGEDLYVVNGDKTRLYTWEQLNAKYQLDKQIREAIAQCDEVQGEFEYTCEEDEINNPDCSVYKIDAKNDGSVYLSMIGAESRNGVGSQHIMEQTPGKLEQLLGIDLSNIKKYAKGITYYPLRIKHFGDDLTPWNTTADAATITPAPSPGNIYPTTDANRNGNYLGRYGVLRNNWYNLTVNSIAGLGEPVVPPPGSDPDDELYNYISVSISVLSWARRDQGADF